MIFFFYNKIIHVITLIIYITLKGTIEGVFAMSSYTWTTLLGQKQDSVFYEVYGGLDGSGAVSQKQGLIIISLLYLIIH